MQVGGEARILSARVDRASLARGWTAALRGRQLLAAAHSRPRALRAVRGRGGRRAGTSLAARSRKIDSASLTGLYVAYET